MIAWGGARSAEPQESSPKILSALQGRDIVCSCKRTELIGRPLQGLDGLWDDGTGPPLVGLTAAQAITLRAFGPAHRPFWPDEHPAFGPEAGLPHWHPK